MTKTEAAEIISRRVRVFCLHNSRRLTMLLIDEVMSEWGVNHPTTLLGKAANVANRKTVMRTAIRVSRELGDLAILPEGY